MPGFAETLDEAARWSLVDFVRANADAARLSGTVPDPSARPLPAPQFSAECPDKAVESVRRQGSRLLHLVFAGSGSLQRLRQLAEIEPFRRMSGVRTVVVAPELSAARRFCTASAPEIAEAYAIYRVAPDAAMEGLEFLIDADGLLIAVRQPGDTRPWVDPVTPDTDLAVIRRAPSGTPLPERHPHVH
jgi:hypothetical protein